MNKKANWNPNDVLVEDCSDNDSDDESVPSDVIEESSSGSGSEAEEQQAPLEVLMKDFMATEPSDNDLGGIEALMKQLFKHYNIDVKEFAKVLVEQNYVTTVMKENLEDVEIEDGEEDDTVFGVYSIINLRAKKNNSAVRQLINHLLEHVQKQSVDGDTRELLKRLLTDSPDNLEITGFLIKEKIINIPGVMGAPCLIQLRNDMKAATAKGMAYKFNYFVHMAKMVRMKNGDDYFVEEEDEMFQESITAHFDIEYPTSLDSTVCFQNHKGKAVSGKMFRRVFIIPDGAMDEFMQKLQSMDSVKDVLDEAAVSGLTI